MGSQFTNTCPQKANRKSTRLPTEMANDQMFEPLPPTCYHHPNGETQFHRTAGLRAGFGFTA